MLKFYDKSLLMYSLHKALISLVGFSISLADHYKNFIVCIFYTMKFDRPKWSSQS